MGNFQTGAGQIGNNGRDAFGIVIRRGRPIHRFFESRSRDQFHCSRNLFDIANGLATFIKCSGVGHGLGSVFRVQCSVFTAAFRRHYLKLRLNSWIAPSTSLVVSLSAFFMASPLFLLALRFSHTSFFLEWMKSRNSVSQRAIFSTATLSR